MTLLATFGMSVCQIDGITIQVISLASKYCIEMDAKILSQIKM